MYLKNSVIDFPKLFNFTATINWFLFDFKPIIPVLQPFLNLSIFFHQNPPDFTLIGFSNEMRNWASVFWNHDLFLDNHDRLPCKMNILNCS